MTTDEQRPMRIDTLGFLVDPFKQSSFTPTMTVKVPPIEAVHDAVHSGIVAMNLTLSAGADYQSTLDAIADYDAFIAANPGLLKKVLSTADLEAARLEGSVGLIYGTQNSAMIDDDLGRVAVFRERGMRVIQLTYNDQNQVGSGSLAPTDDGLSEFGREYLEVLNANRVIVDLSHGSYRLTMDVARASTADRPPSITHTGCAALAPTPRNKIDEELRAIADLGGYVGIYTMPFLALGRSYDYDDLFAHVDHAVNVCGEDAIGIGTDQGICDLGDMEIVKRDFAAQVRARQAAGISAPGEDPDILPYPLGFRGPEKYRDIERALQAGGYSSTRIEKIMGGNFADYAGRIWGE